MMNRVHDILLISIFTEKLRLSFVNHSLQLLNMVLQMKSIVNELFVNYSLQLLILIFQL